MFTLDDQEEMQLWQDLQDIGQVVEKSLWVVTHALTHDMAVVTKGFWSLP